AYQSNHRYYTDPIDADFSPLDAISIINNYGKGWNNVKVATQEFTFSSPAATTAPLKWIAGTYLFYQNNPVKQTTRFGKDAMMLGMPDKSFSLINTTKTKGSGGALYGQATYNFNEKIDLTAGLRYDYEHKKQSVLGEYQKDPNRNSVFAFRSDTSATANFNALSPKLSVAYHSSENNTLFVTYSKGYRAGGLTPLSSDPSQPPLFAFKPEYSNNIEAGSKNKLLNNRLLLNVTAFYSTITDVQVPTLVLPDAVTITRNTGELTSKGVEMELNTALLKGLEFNYSFGYTDATYKEFKVAQGGTEVNLRGKRQIFTPEITSLLATQYNFSVNKKQTMHLVIRGEWKYLGRQYFDLANTIVQPSYSLFNTRLGIATKKFSLMFWGRNMSDKRYISYGYDFGAIHLGDPKTYGIAISTRFN
ncbi:MAG: TonB-dependent receptor, partial [Chitinophagaceae bacterium]